MKFILDKIIRGYQLFLSPFLGSSCRFTPSCSEYTRLAVQEYGSVKGIYLGIKRILRCHPWSEGGYDPVTPKDKLNDKS